MKSILNSLANALCNKQSALTDDDLYKLAKNFDIFIILIEKYESDILFAIRNSPIAEFSIVNNDINIVFSELLSIALNNTLSQDIIKLYTTYLERDHHHKDDIDNIIASEIILDTIYDIALSRVNNFNDPDDSQLLDLLATYHKYHQALNVFFDKFIASSLNLHISTEILADNRKFIMIKEFCQSINMYRQYFQSIWPSNNYSKDLLHLVITFEIELDFMSKTLHSRLRSFMPTADYDRLIKMNHETADSYFASIATENMNMREAKNLYRSIQETDSYLGTIRALKLSIPVDTTLITSLEQDISAAINTDRVGGKHKE